MRSINPRFTYLTLTYCILHIQAARRNVSVTWSHSRNALPLVQSVKPSTGTLSSTSSAFRRMHSFIPFHCSSTVVSESIRNMSSARLEACSHSKSDLSSIDFAFSRFFMNLFRINNIETVKVCQFFLVYLFQALCCAVGQTSSNRNLVFVLT